MHLCTPVAGRAVTVTAAGGGGFHGDVITHCTHAWSDVCVRVVKRLVTQRSNWRCTMLCCRSVGLPFSSVQLSSIPAFISAPALTAVMGRGRDAAVSSPHQLLLLKQTSRRWIIAALYSLPHQYTPCQPSPVTARLTHLTHSLTHTLVHSRYSHIVTLVH